MQEKGEYKQLFESYPFVKGLEANKSHIRPENYGKVLEFLNYKKAKITKKRLYKTYHVLKEFSLILKSGFREVTNNEVSEWEEHIKQLTGETKNSYNKVIKCFYNWLYDGEKKPKCIADLKGDYKPCLIDPTMTITEDDINRLIKEASLRDKALICVLWEIGARISELLATNVGHYNGEGQLRHIYLPQSKTETREVPIVFSVPYMNQYMDNHKYRDDPSKPLFYFEKEGKCKRLTYEAVRKMLKEIGKKAGVNKPLNPHHFRRSSATLNADMPYFAFCKTYGWDFHSKQAKRYVRLSKKDLVNEKLKRHGIIAEEKKENKNPIVCRVCDHVNMPYSKFCSKCSNPLDLKTAIDFKEKTEKVSNLIPDNYVQEIVRAIIGTDKEQVLKELKEQILKEINNN